MGGRTNNAGDWLTGKTQDQADQVYARREANAKLLRSSKYTKGIDEQTGQEYDFRDRIKKSGLPSASGSWDNLSDEQWGQMGEGAIANQNKDPFGMPTAPGAPKAKAPPVMPDATDAALQKARTSFAMRLQVGKNRKSSFSSGQLGGFDVTKPVLGGY